MMRLRQRAFDFPRPVSHGAALAAIAEALRDEGLFLVASDNAADRVRMVRLGAIDRYIVPGWRIGGILVVVR